MEKLGHRIIKELNKAHGPFAYWKQVKLGDRKVNLILL